MNLAKDIADSFLSKGNTTDELRGTHIIENHSVLKSF